MLLSSTKKPTNNQIVTVIDTPNHVLLYSIRTRRLTHVPVTHVNTMARVPMYSRLMISTRALVLYHIPEFNVRLSSLCTTTLFKSLISSALCLSAKVLNGNIFYNNNNNENPLYVGLYLFFASFISLQHFF